MASLLPNNNYNDDESKGDGGNDVELVHEDSGLLNGNCGDEEEVQNHEASDLTQEQSVSNNADDNNKKARNEISIVDQSIIDKLPNGDAGRHVVYTILTMLDMKSLSSLIYSSFIQLFCKRQKDNTLYQLCKDIQHPYERAYKLQKQKKIQLADKLKKKYEKEFPATLWGTPTPLICACQKGRLEDVKLLITGHDANGTVMYMGIPCRAMTLKEYVNQFGLGSRAHEGKFTPLTIAALYKHFHIVQYLIEQCGVYPGDALYWATSENPHLAASDNKKNTDLIRFLLNHMSADSINNKLMGETPLDRAYKNEIPNKQEIIDLIRSKGGKRGDFA